MLIPTTNEASPRVLQPSSPHTLQLRTIRLRKVRENVEIWRKAVLLTGVLLVIIGVWSLPRMTFRAFEGNGCFGGMCGKVGLCACLMGILTGTIAIQAGRKRQIRLARWYSLCIIALIVLCLLTAICLPILRFPSPKSALKSYHSHHFPPKPRPDRPSSPQLDRLREMSRPKGEKDPPKPGHCGIPRSSYMTYYLLFAPIAALLLFTSLRFRRVLQTHQATISVEIEEIRLVI